MKRFEDIYSRFYFDDDDGSGADSSWLFDDDGDSKEEIKPAAPTPSSAPRRRTANTPARTANTPIGNPNYPQQKDKPVTPPSTGEVTKRLRMVALILTILGIVVFLFSLNMIYAVMGEPLSFGRPTTMNATICLIVMGIAIGSLIAGKRGGKRINYVIAASFGASLFFASLLNFYSYTTGAYPMGPRILFSFAPFLLAGIVFIIIYAIKKKKDFAFISYSLFLVAILEVIAFLFGTFVFKY